MDRVEAIRQRITDAFTPEHLDIIDESHLHRGHVGAASGAGHFNVTIVSGKFAEQKMLARHRMVYEAVNDLMQTEIHALSIRAVTPEENLSKKE